MVNHELFVFDRFILSSVTKIKVAYFMDHSVVGNYLIILWWKTQRLHSIAFRWKSGDTIEVL